MDKEQALEILENMQKILNYAKHDINNNKYIKRKLEDCAKDIFYLMFDEIWEDNGCIFESIYKDWDIKK